MLRDGYNVQFEGTIVRTAQEPTLLRENNIQRDQGWSWIVLFAAFLTLFITNGMHASFGILYAALISHFGSGREETGIPVIYNVFLQKHCFAGNRANQETLRGWKHCFLAMFPEGGQTRKHCLLAMCLPKVNKPGNINCFLAMSLEGGQTKKHCFLAMFPEGGQTRKHFLLATCLPKVDKPGNIVS
jgi:hypothetical protein